MQNQSKDSFLIDIKKNPKDCMAITLKSGKELKNKEEEKKKLTKNQERVETVRDNKQFSSELTEKSEKAEV